MRTIRRGNAAEAAVLAAYRGRADLVAVHLPDPNRIFIVAVEDCPAFRGYLRLVDPRNNQRSGVRFTTDYEFGTWLRGLLATPPCSSPSSPTPISRAGKDASPRAA